MAEYATVQVNILNLRQAATTTSPILAQLPRTTRVQLLAEPDEHGWVQVQVGQWVGFVAAAFLQPEAPAHEPPPPPEAAPRPRTPFDAFIEALPVPKLPTGYRALWKQQARLGLPDPFDTPPIQLNTLKDVERMWVNGFGPNTFSLLYWTTWYRRVGGIHNGYDCIVRSGTPLLAVSDGVILTNWRFMGNAADRTLALWCFLPEQYRDARGQRMMSNVIVAYAHMSDHTRRRHREVVRAGDIIGLSGTPAMSGTNAHLHFEVHLLQGDPTLPQYRDPGTPLREYDRPQPEGTRTPWNGLLFFSPRLLAYWLHQNATHGYAYRKLPPYPTPAMLRRNGLVNYPRLDDFTLAYYRYGVPILWNSADGSHWDAGMVLTEELPERIGAFPAFEPYEAWFLADR